MTASDQFHLDAQFSKLGVTINYPTDWEIDEQQGEDEYIVTLYSPETPFLNLFILADRPSLDEMLESAVEAFQSEYDEIDIYPKTEIRRIDHVTVVSQQLEFVCENLVSGVNMFGYRSGRVSVLLMYQGYDDDLKLYQPMFEAIRESLMIEFGDDDIIV